MKTKRFDCVDMMHRGAKRIYRTTKNLSRDEELAYWRQKASQLQLGQTKRGGTRATAGKRRKRT
jgi:hypothetical protein